MKRGLAANAGNWESCYFVGFQQVLVNDVTVYNAQMVL